MADPGRRRGSASSLEILWRPVPLKAILDSLLRMRTAEAELDPATGRRNLTYSRRFLLTSFAVALVANGAFTLTLAVTREDPSSLAWAFGTIGMMWVAAMVGAWDAFLIQLAFTSEGIIAQRRGGRAILIPWGAVSSVRYSRLGSWFSFRAPGYPTVRVSVYRNGLASLARCARERLGARAAGEASEQLLQAALNP